MPEENDDSLQEIIRYHLRSILHQFFPEKTEVVLKEQGSNNNNKVLTTNSNGQVQNTSLNANGIVTTDSNKNLQAVSSISKAKINDFAHTHLVNDISDFPSSIEPSAHTHTKNEITDFPLSMTPTSHRHNISEIDNFPTEMTPTAHQHSWLTDINDKPSIPEANTDNSKIQMNGTRSAGGLATTTYAKADHVHPSDTNKSKVTFSRTLNNGTKIGTLNIDGTNTDLFCQTNTNTTYTAGDGLTLNNTTFKANFGTTNTTIARGNHTHDDKLDDIYSNDLNAGEILNKILVTNGSNEIKTISSLSTSDILYGEGSQARTPLTQIVDDIYSFLDNTSTYQVSINQNTKYLDTDYCFMYLTKVGRFVFCEYGLRTKTGTSLPASGNSIYNEYNEIAVGTINDNDYIPDSAKYFDCPTPSSANNYCNIRVVIGNTGAVKIRVTPGKSINNYGSGIYSFMSTYQHQ